MGSPKATRPVRTRVTVAATSVTLVAMAVAATGIVWSQRLVLTARLDRQLEQRSDLLRTGLATGSFPGGAGLFQVIDATGQLIASSPGFVVPIATTAGDSAPRTVDGIPESDDRARVLSRQVDTAAGRYLIHTAEPMDAIDEAATALALSLAVAVPIITGLLGGVIWSMVGATLRPVEAIRSEVAKIGLSDLSRRVPESGNDEVGRLARTMNEMLETLERSSTKQRRFVADASHELRTPLARMRSELEVDRSHPETADPAATTTSLIEEVDRLQQLVDDLLVLARAESNPSSTTIVDLAALVAGETVVRGDGVVVTIEVEPSPVRGNAGQLARMVRNLIDNALRHATATVSVSSRPVGTRVILTVTDDGPGIPPGERDRVFDPFYRLDEARTAADGGTGLGLTIVREIALAHSGSVEVDPDHHPGARLVVTFPAATG